MLLKNKHNEIETYDKIKAVIYSCETPDHFKVATNMVIRFDKVFSRFSKKNDALPFILEDILFQRMRTVLGERVREK